MTQRQLHHQTLCSMGDSSQNLGTWSTTAQPEDGSTYWRMSLPTDSIGLKPFETAKVVSPTSRELVAKV